MSGCLKCGDTGSMPIIDPDGTIHSEPCTCGAGLEVRLPSMLSVPTQYQGVKFDKSLVRKDLDESYGRYLDKLLKMCTTDLGNFHKNILICSPPNSSKTVFAYTVYGMLYPQGVHVPEIMDLMEAREVLLNYYGVDRDVQSLLSTAKIAFIKVPQDLPPKFAETMSTIIERRVRQNASTIFLTSCSVDDIMAQDKFNKFKALKGDGSYNSLEVVSWNIK